MSGYSPLIPWSPQVMGRGEMQSEQSPLLCSGTQNQVPLAEPQDSFLCYLQAMRICVSSLNYMSLSFLTCIRGQEAAATATTHSC